MMRRNDIIALLKLPIQQIGLLFLLPIATVAIDLSAGFNFDGVLLDSNNAPISSASTLTLRIYDINKTCLLYEESQSVTADSQGNFSIKVGSQTGDAKRTANDPALAWATIFQNDAQVRAAGTNCASGYTPASGDNRYLRVIVNTTTLSPDFAINSMPSATVAETLQGKKVTDFVQIAANSTLNSNLTIANTKSIKFLDNTTNTVGFTAPSVATTTLWTLPTADGTANQCLATNGSATLSWYTPAIPSTGGTITSGSLSVSGSAAISVSTSAAAAISSTTSSTSGTAVSGVSSAATGSTVGGKFEANSTTGTALVAKSGNAATKTLSIQGATGQTANLTEWSVGGTVVGVVDAAGKFGIGTTSPLVKLDVNGGIRAGAATSGASCAGTPEGTFSYDSTLHAIVFCNNSSVWAEIGNSTSTVKAIYQQVFTSSGTYTPHAGLLHAQVEVVGGGGGGGSTVDGGNGGTSTLGALLTANGGFGGGLGDTGGTANCRGGTGGSVSAQGVATAFSAPGTNGGSAGAASATAMGGVGAPSHFGGGGGWGNNNMAGGGGGSGAYTRAMVTAAQIGASQTVTIGAGGTFTGNAAAGGSGVIVITEYCNQ